MRKRSSLRSILLVLAVITIQSALELKSSIDQRNFNNGFISRAPRSINDQEFSEILETLTKANQVFNAILLECQLIKESIPINNAIGGLIGMDPGDVDELEKFDKKTVDDFFEKLKNLPIQSSAAMDTLEKMILFLKSRSAIYDRIGDVKDTSKLKSYFQTVDGMKSVNFTVVDEVFKASESVITFLPKVDALPDTITPGERKNSKYISDFDELVKALDHLQKATQDFNTLLHQLEPFSHLSKGTIPFDSPQYAFIQLVSSYYHSDAILKPPLDDDLQELVTNLDKLGGVSTEHSLSKTFLNLIAKIFSMRLLEVSKRDGISIDASQTISTLRRDYDSSQLVGELQFLKALNDAVHSFQRIFDSKIQPGIPAVNEAFRLHQMVPDSTVASNWNSFLTNISDLLKKTPRSTPDFTNKAKDLFTKSHQIMVKLGKVVPLLKELSSSGSFAMLQQYDDFESIANLSGNNIEAEKQLENAIKKIKAYGKRNELLALATELKASLDPVKNEIDGFGKLVTDVASGEPIITGMLARQETSEFTQFFDEVKSNHQQLQALANAVNLIHGIREMKSDPKLLSDISSNSDLVSKSIQPMKDAKNAAGMVKQRKKEVTEVMRLEDLQKSAEKFGEGVQLLRMILEALKSRNSFEELVSEGSKVLLEIRLLKDVDLGLLEEIEQGWGDFEATKVEVEEMLSRLKSRQDGMNNPVRRIRRNSQVSKFADFISVFKGLNGLKNLDLKTSQRIGALEKLEPLVSNKSLTDSVKKSLKALESLDLQFARFDAAIQEMPTTLQNIDLAFQKLPKKIPSVTPKLSNKSSTPSPRKLTTSVPITSSESVTAVKSEDETDWKTIGGIIGGVVGVIVIVLAIVVAFCCVYQRKKNEKKKKNIAKEMKGDKQDAAVKVESGESKESQASSTPETRKQADVKKEEKVPVLNEEPKLKQESKGAVGEVLEPEPKVVEVRKVAQEDEKFMGFPAADGNTYDPARRFFKNDDKYECLLIEADVLMPMYREVAYTPHLLINLNSLDLKKSLMANWFDHFLPPIPNLPGKTSQCENQMDKARNKAVKCWNTSLVTPRYRRGFVHASAAGTPLNLGTYFLTQGPIGPNEKGGYEGDADFWNMAIFQSVKYVVMLGDFEEDGVVKCSHYFPEDEKQTMDFDGTYVKNVDMQVEAGGEVVYRKMHCETRDRLRNKVKATIYHYHIRNWKEGTVPTSEKVINAILHVHKDVSRNKVPVIVHGSSGTGRGCCFVGMEFLAQMIANKDPVQLDFFVNNFRKYCWGAFQTGEQLFFVQYMAFRILQRDALNGELDALLNFLPGQLEMLRHYNDMGEYNDLAMKSLEEFKAKNWEKQLEATQKSNKSFFGKLMAPFRRKASKESNNSKENDGKDCIKTQTIDETVQK